MDSRTPDYGRCSLDELYDVRRWLDADRYPDRAAALAAEIALRESGPRRPPIARDDTTRSRRRIFPDSRVLGIYMIVAGAISLASVFDAGLDRPPGKSILVLGVPVAMYGLLLVAGIMTLRRLAGWRWTSLIAWAVEVPSLQLGHFRYNAFSVPAFEWKVWPLLGFSISTSGQFDLSWFHEWQPLYIGVNAIALSAVTFMANRIATRKAAENRARVGGNAPNVAG